MWKLFAARMAAQHTRCDESTVFTDDTSRASSSDRSAASNGGDRHSADHKVQRNPACKEATQVRKQNPTPTCRITFPSHQHMVKHPVVPPAKITGIKETAPSTDMSGKSKIAKGALLRRKRQVPHKATKALPLPLGPQPGPTRKRESLRKLSPPRIPDYVNIAKCTKQRRDKPPVETIHFQTHSFTDMMGDNSKKAKEEKVGMSSYVQLEIIYPACEIVEDDAESGTAFGTPSIVKTGRRPPTSVLAQLRVAWYME